MGNYVCKKRQVDTESIFCTPSPIHTGTQSHPSVIPIRHRRRQMRIYSNPFDDPQIKQADYLCTIAEHHKLNLCRVCLNRLNNIDPTKQIDTHNMKTTNINI
jgi:hypothetical protein